MPTEEKLKFDFCGKYIPATAQHAISMADNFDLIVGSNAFEFKVEEKDYNLAFAELLINSGKRKKYFNRYIIVYLNAESNYVAKTFYYSDSYFNNMAVKFEKILYLCTKYYLKIWKYTAL